MEIETLLVDFLDGLYGPSTGVANGQVKVGHVNPCPIHLLSYSIAGDPQPSAGIVVFHSRNI